MPGSEFDDLAKGLEGVVIDFERLLWSRRRFNCSAKTPSPPYRIPLPHERRSRTSDPGYWPGLCLDPRNRYWQRL